MENHEGGLNTQNGNEIKNFFQRNAVKLGMLAAGLGMNGMIAANTSEAASTELSQTELIMPYSLILQGQNDVKTYNMSGMGTYASNLYSMVWTPKKVASSGSCTNLVATYKSASLTPRGYKESYCPIEDASPNIGENYNSSTGNNVTVPLGSIESSLGTAAADSAGLEKYTGTANKLIFTMNYVQHTEKVVIDFEKQTKSQAQQDDNSTEKSIKTLTIFAKNAPSFLSWAEHGSVNAHSKNETKSVTFYSRTWSL